MAVPAGEQDPGSPLSQQASNRFIHTGHSIMLCPKRAPLGTQGTGLDHDQSEIAAIFYPDLILANPEIMGKTESFQYFPVQTSNLSSNLNILYLPNYYRTPTRDTKTRYFRKPTKPWILR